MFQETPLCPSSSSGIVADPCSAKGVWNKELDTTARVYALERLTTQPISEFLQCPMRVHRQHGRGHLHGTAEVLAIETDGLHDEARLREQTSRHIAPQRDEARQAPIGPAAKALGHSSGVRIWHPQTDRAAGQMP
jgi:hypothetical protein